MLDALFGGQAPWFTAPALFGTGFLVLQLGLGQLGGDMDGDGVSDMDMDDPGAEAKLLSTQSIAAFMVGFGWIGLVSFRAVELSFMLSVMMGVGAGFGVGYMIYQITRSMMKLQSDANLHLDQTIGWEAPVYITIPPRDHGSGRIMLVFNNGQHELNARQMGDDPIAAHATVRIVSADEAGGSVVVEPV
ncbi:MAG: hypothetical protein AB8F26_03850 [Phycisphaerales bacterium]